MAASTIAMMVSPNSMIKLGGHHVFLFLFMPFPIKICLVEIFTRAWPGSSLVKSYFCHYLYKLIILIFLRRRGKFSKSS